jgi:hypothetical protein
VARSCNMALPRPAAKGRNMSEPPIPSSAESSPQAKGTQRARLPWWALLCVVLVVLFGIGGFVHVVHGGSAGFTVIAKDGWGTDDTFVDMDEIEGKPLISQMHRAKTIRALISAGVIAEPDFIRNAREVREGGTAGPDEGIATLTKIRQTACACTNKTCAEEVQRDLAAAANLKTRDMDRATQIAGEIADCMMKTTR